MANAVYPLAKASFLSGAIDLTTATIKIALVRGYTYSASHQYLSSVATVVGTAQTLGSKTVTTGIFDAADPTYTAVTAGAACESLVIYKDTGSAATSNLIAYIDTATGLPVTPNGGDITVAFDNGASKIFAL